MFETGNITIVLVWVTPTMFGHLSYTCVVYVTLYKLQGKCLLNQYFLSEGQFWLELVFVDPTNLHLEEFLGYKVKC